MFVHVVAVVAAAEHVDLEGERGRLKADRLTEEFRVALVVKSIIRVWIYIILLESIVLLLLALRWAPSVATAITTIIVVAAAVAPVIVIARASPLAIPAIVVPAVPLVVVTIAVVATVVMVVAL